MIGEILENSGWRQGSIVNKVDADTLMSFIGGNLPCDGYLIVASQSCDIANNNIEIDPNVELMIGRPISKKDGNLTFNKNPRQLHTELKKFTGDTGLFSYIHIEIRIAERIQIPKNYLSKFLPDDSIQIEADQLESCVNWLSARYSRPALPTTFNNRIAKADPKGKLRQKAKNLNEMLSGVYVEIIPFEELQKDHNYSVNLLGLVTDINESHIQQAEISLEGIADILKAAKMEVKTAVRSEANISLSQIRRFKRFYFDDLSFKEDTSLPPEVNTNL